MAVELWTAEQVAVYLKYNVETVRRQTRSGHIPAIKVGRFWRYRRDRLDAWLDAGCPSSDTLPGLFEPETQAQD